MPGTAGPAGAAGLPGPAMPPGAAGRPAHAGPPAAAGSLAIPVVWSEACLRHQPGGEVWLGVREPGTEVPERAEVILAGLAAAGAGLVTAVPHGDEVLLSVHDQALVDHLRTIWADWEAGGYVSEYGRDRVVPYVFPTAGLLAELRIAGAGLVTAVPHGDEVLLSVHDQALVDHLRTIWADWEAGGYVSEYGRDRVVPYVFPTAGLLAGLPLRSPAAVHGRVGRFCYDTMTLVGPGSWAAIRAAVDVALTAADLVAAGAPAAYALCRPPGHHAGPGAHGGSCYLNNAAVAAQALRQAGAERVAVIDIDAHHGNGTQAIFYGRPDVYYGSLHVDPGAGWFPHYAGYADEPGSGAGAGANRNLPLAPGTGDAGWLAALDVLCAEAAGRGMDALVVSLGLDAAVTDPESPLRVTGAGYRAAGERLGRLGRPAVLIQEGGYDLASLGPLTVAALTGVAAGAAGG